MAHEFCPVCGSRLIRQSSRCRVCCLEIDGDGYFPFLYEETSSPDTWDEGGIPDEGPDQEGDGWQYM